MNTKKDMLVKSAVSHFTKNFAVDEIHFSVRELIRDDAECHLGDFSTVSSGLFIKKKGDDVIVHLPPDGKMEYMQSIQFLNSFCYSPKLPLTPTVFEALFEPPVLIGNGKGLTAEKDLNDFFWLFPVMFIMHVDGKSRKKWPTVYSFNIKQIPELVKQMVQEEKGYTVTLLSSCCGKCQEILLMTSDEKSTGGKIKFFSVTDAFVQQMLSVAEDKSFLSQTAEALTSFIQVTSPLPLIKLQTQLQNLIDIHLSELQLKTDTSKSSAKRMLVNLNESFQLSFTAIYNDVVDACGCLKLDWHQIVPTEQVFHALHALYDEEYEDVLDYVLLDII